MERLGTDRRRDGGEKKNDQINAPGPSEASDAHTLFGEEGVLESTPMDADQSENEAENTGAEATPSGSEDEPTTSIQCTQHLNWRGIEPSTASPSAITYQMAILGYKWAA